MLRRRPNRDAIFLAYMKWRGREFGRGAVSCADARSEVAGGEKYSARIKNRGHVRQF